MVTAAGILVNEQDLNQVTPETHGAIAVHDGTGDTTPRGLYWYDSNGGQWVKLSQNEPSSSVTIGL